MNYVEKYLLKIITNSGQLSNPIKSTIVKGNYEESNELKYWKEVKQEIEKL